MDIKPSLKAPRAIWYQNQLFPASVKYFDPDRGDISSFRPTIRLFADRPSFGLFFYSTWQAYG